MSGSGLRLVEAKNVFEWEIVDFWKKKEYHDSPDIQIGDRNFYLIAERNSSNYFAGTFWGFYLAPRDPTDFSWLSYTMSVVDDRGQDFMTRTGTLEGVHWDQPLLGFLTETSLRQNNLTKDDILTVRLTLELKADGPDVTVAAKREEKDDDIKELAAWAL